MLILTLVGDILCLTSKEVNHVISAKGDNNEGNISSFAGCNHS